jgi:hypothetical protein
MIAYNIYDNSKKDLYHTSSANVNFLAATGPLAFIPLSSLTSWYFPFAPLSLPSFSSFWLLFGHL